MKTNTKGFTLIELLAVIVILAIIALIATPIVLNLIDKARKGAAESSAYSYVKSAETAAVVKLMGSTGLNLSGKTCTVQEDKTKLTCNDDATTTLELDIKGDLPDKDSTVTFGSQGEVETAKLTINTYKVEVTSDGEAHVVSNWTTPANPEA